MIDLLHFRFNLPFAVTDKHYYGEKRNDHDVSPTGHTNYSRISSETIDVEIGGWMEMELSLELANPRGRPHRGAVRKAVVGKEGANPPDSPSSCKNDVEAVVLCRQGRGY